MHVKRLPCVCVCVYVERREICFCFFVSVCTQVCVYVTMCSCLCLLCGMCLVLSVHACERVHRERTSPLSKWIALQSVPPFLRSCHLHADRHIHRQATGRQAERPVGGVGGQAGCRGRQAQLACSTQGYVLPEVEKWWLSPQQENVPNFKGKITMVFTCGRFSVWCEVNVLNDGS